MFRSGILHLLLFLTITVPAYSLPNVTLDDSLTSNYIGTHIEYVEDKNNRVTIKTVEDAALNWNKSKKDSLNFGFTPSTYWFRFKINNTTGHEIKWFLEISYPMLDYIDLYIPDSKGTFTVKKTGDHYSFNEREIKDRAFIMAVKTPPGTSTYYIRLETTSSMNFVPIMWSYSALLDRMNTELPMHWIYYGLLIVMAVYNMFLYVSIRERSYIYYTVFIVTWIFFQLTLNGFAFQYLWPDWIWWGNNCLPFFMCFTEVWVVLFVRNVIDTPEHFPRIDKLVNYLMILPLSIWTACSLSGYYRLSITVATGLTVYLSFFLSGVIVYTAYKGSRPARFLLVGFLFLCLSLILFTLKTFGALPSIFITRWSIQLGISIMVVSFSLALADKINIMSNELQELNLNLEEKVRDRTEELDAANQELESINDNLVTVNESLEESYRIRQQDMSIAATVQTAFFPKEVPPSDEYDVAFFFKPLVEISGDFYDFYFNTENRLNGLGLFDVSGHGVSSGLITLIARSIISRHFSTLPNEKLSTVMDGINNELIHEIGNSDNYLTGIIVRFDNGCIDYVNGGHPELLWKSQRSGKVSRVLDKNSNSIKGHFLGITDMNQEFNTLKIKIGSGDCLFMYTDSLMETKDPDGTMFETEGIMESLKQAPNSSAQEILDYILERFNSFKGKETKLDDDLTAILIRKK